MGAYNKLLFPVLFLLVFSIFVSAQKVDNYVVDNVGVFSEPDKQATITYLKELEKQTSVQFVIYVTDTIPEDYDLESYSLKIAEENKIGHAGNDNGLLFFLATGDREYRWEVGYGIEDVLNTPLLGRISRIYMVPDFEKGNFAEGTLRGTAIISKILLNSTDEDIMALKQPFVQNEIPKSKIISIIVFFIFFFLLPLFARSKKGRLNNAIYFGAGSMMFSRGFGRGGFGGMGGFSGGGGGFGGGGFSGGF